MATSETLSSPLFSSLQIKELWETVKSIKTKNSTVINTVPLDVVQNYLLQECQNLKLDDNQQKKIAYRLKELQKLQIAQIQLEDSVRINTRLQELSDDVTSGSADIVDVASDLHLCFLAVLDRDLASVTDRFRNSLQIDKNLKRSILYELLNAPLNDILTFINQEQLTLFSYDYQNIFIALKHLSQKSDHEISKDLLYPVYEKIQTLEQNVYDFQPGELINLFVQHSDANFLSSKELRNLCCLIRSSTSCDFEEFKKQMKLNFSDKREQHTFHKLFDIYYRKFKEYDTQDKHELSSDKSLSKLSIDKTTVEEQICLTEPATAADLTNKALYEETYNTSLDELLSAEQELETSDEHEHGPFTSWIGEVGEYQSFSDNILAIRLSSVSLVRPSFNESLPFNEEIFLCQGFDPLIVPASADDDRQITFLIDGIDSPRNVLEFKPDVNEPGLFIVRLKKAQAIKLQKISEKIASSLMQSLIFKTSQDSLILSVAYGHILLQGFPARNIGELKERINDPKLASCIQLRPASMGEFDGVFETIEQSSECYILSCHSKSSSHRILFIFDSQLTLIKIIESVVRSVCYVRSTNCDMDSIYEISSQNEYDRDTIAFEELVHSLFVSNQCENLLSGILPNVTVKSELLKKDISPYKLTMESNVNSLNVNSMSSMECVYRSVKTLSLAAHDLQKDPTIEFHVRLHNKGEQALRDACDMAYELAKSKESFTPSALDHDRYFTWN